MPAFFRSSKPDPAEADRLAREACTRAASVIRTARLHLRCPWPEPEAASLAVAERAGAAIARWVESHPQEAAGIESASPRIYQRDGLCITVAHSPRDGGAAIVEAFHLHAADPAQTRTPVRTPEGAVAVFRALLAAFPAPAPADAPVPIRARIRTAVARLLVRPVG